MSLNRTAIGFDDPPVYDHLIKDDLYMSDVYVAWISSFIQTLSGYLSQYGIFVPKLTTSQRDEIQSPQLGQLIYNTTVDALQVWQIKTGTAAWRSITTTP